MLEHIIEKLEQNSVTINVTRGVHKVHAVDLNWPQGHASAYGEGDTVLEAVIEAVLDAALKPMYDTSSEKLYASRTTDTERKD